MSMQSEDLDAIDYYVKNTDVRTKEATRLRDEWIKWFDSVSWLDKQFDSNTYDLARNMKNAFDMANAKNEYERRAIRESLKTALTTEELRGEPRRMLSDGTYNQQEEPFFPTRVKVAGGIGVAVLFGIWAIKKIYIDPFVRR